MTESSDQVRVTLEPLEKEGQYGLAVRRGSTVREYAAVTRVCPSPFCGCKSLAFFCGVPGDELSFHLNLDSREPSAISGEETRYDSELAEAVARGLDDEDYQQLRSSHLERKRRIIAEVEHGAPAGEPPRGLESTDHLVPFIDLFPLAKPFVIEEGDRRWLAVDQYCLAQGCSCNEVLITFAAIDDDGRANDVAGVRYSLTDGTWKADRELPGSRTRCAQLLAYLEEDEADLRLRLRLRRRHDLMRGLADRARELYPVSRADTDWADEEWDDPAPTTVRTTKIGRNDPCPCGSGKKFKKCCGA